MVTKKKATTKKRTAKKTARPTRGTSRAKGRPNRKRVIGDHRDMLNVENMDPEYFYYWMLGTSENDKRIIFSLRDDWEMVDATVESDLVIGDHAVGKSDKLGSVYRIPAARRGNEEYLYLMRLPRDIYDARHELAMQVIDDQERELTRRHDPDGDDETGQYGKTTITDPRRERLTK